jgi:hypothetical protein
VISGRLGRRDDPREVGVQLKLDERQALKRIPDERTIRAEPDTNILGDRSKLRARDPSVV